MALVQASDFMRELRVEFPGLVDELDDDVWRGLLHLETACFARFVQRVIDDGDRAEVARCFEFARRWWLTNDDDVQNALAVSCIEHLNFNDGKVQRAWAFDLLPPALQDAAVALGTAPHRQTDRRG
jgi:hypothetical protein